MTGSATNAFRAVVATGLLMVFGNPDGFPESQSVSPDESISLIIRQVSGAWEMRGSSQQELGPEYRCGGIMEVNEVVREADGRLRFNTRITDSEGNFTDDEPAWTGLIDYQLIAENGRQLTICVQYDQENRVNDQGKLAHWCMIMTGPDRYVWRERSWPFGHFTEVRYRCKGPGA